MKAKILQQLEKRPTDKRLAFKMQWQFSVVGDKLSNLKYSNIPIGWLINFGKSNLEIKAISR